jgi:Protein of unknown function (DUF1604)
VAAPSSSSVYTSGTSGGGITRKRARTAAQQYKNERFHGAFTGGFSAGYYNTVGSREGWQPTEYGASTQTRKELGQDVPQQSIHSFMDEQDHNEWGGPQGISNEFLSTDILAGATKTKEKTAVDPFTVQFRSGVGEQLIRVLGWRGSNDSSAAYVLETDGTAESVAGNAGEPSYHQILSTKRLRKIEMSQVQVKLPQPKLDLCGLGYEPFRDAPEFARHFQARRKRAELRAAKVGAGQSSSGTARAYRTSDIYDDEDDDNIGYGGVDRMRQQQQRRGRSPNASSSRTYVSKDEDADDFVGSRSFGGFALLDDEDDTYDDHGSRPNPEAFDTELDLDEEADHDTGRLDSAQQSRQRAPDEEKSVQEFFSSWATSSLAPATAGGTAVTSDGRPILPGFVLSATVTSGTKRYRGPDVPTQYEVANHLFGPREHPLVYQALLHAERLQSKEDTYQKSVREALRLNSAVHSSPPTTANLSPIRAMSHKLASFAGVSKAMESRFTKASSAHETRTGAVLGEAPVAGSSRIEKATRTFATFAPSTMLCKRLGVPVPKNFELASVTGRTKEESFFQNEILSRIPGSRDKAESSAATRDQATTSTGTLAPPSDQEALLAALNKQIPQQSPGDDRPPVALYKSIFEPSNNNPDEDPSDANHREAKLIFKDEKVTRESPTSSSRTTGYTDAEDPRRSNATHERTGDRTLDSEALPSLRHLSSGDASREVVDDATKPREHANPSDNGDASLSTGSVGLSTKSRKRGKDHKRKRKKLKGKKRKRAH